MKKRVLALLLAAVLLINSVPMAVFAEDAPASVDVSPAEAPIAPNTEPEEGSGVVVMSADETAAEPEAEPFIMLAAEEPEAQPEPCDTCGVVGCEKDHIKCIACSNYDCTVKHEYCNTCEKYDCGVDHTRLPLTSTGPNEDYSGDVGKFAVMNEKVQSMTVSEGAGGAVSDFWHDDFLSGTVFVIDGVYVDGNGVWYQVSFCKGGTNPDSTFAAGWPVDPWIKQADDEGDALRFVKLCDVCGEPDCKKTHVWCNTCKKYDCGVNHNLTPPATGCGCCEDCIGDEGCDCSCPACDFYEEPETTDEVSETIIGANGTRLSFAVTGEGIPADARLEVTDETGLIDADIDGVGIYNIKVRANGDYWQPTPGETVSVSLPVEENLDTVNVYHLLEDPAIIRYMLENGLLEPIDVSFGVGDEEFRLVEAAVDAYQEATGTDDICLLAEAFMGVEVTDGVATVDANGFSMFVKDSGGNYVEVEGGFADLNNGDTVYVRPGEFIQVTSEGFIPSVQLKDDNSIANQLDGQSIGWTSAHTYVFVSKSATPGTDEFSITTRSVGWFEIITKKVTFKVVEYFDYGNVYLGIVDHDEPYPNEVDIQSKTSVNRYYTAQGLSTTESAYNTLPRSIVDVDALEQSADLIDNSVPPNVPMTAYGIEDKTGFVTDAFFWTTTEDGKIPFDTLSEEIMDAYFAQHPELDQESYRLVPYVIKHETIGDNAGWYINCKVELKDTYLLQYDYNFPQGYDSFDIQSGNKPLDTNISTTDADADGNVTTTIGPFETVTIKTKLTNPNNSSESKEITATLTHWCTTADGTGQKFAVGAQTYSLAINGNKTFYAVWDVKIPSNWIHSTFDWTIKNTLVDALGNPVSGDAEFQYSLDVGTANSFPLQYNLYNYAGQVIAENKVFDVDFNTGRALFTLTGNQYIVIKGVPIGEAGSEYTYVVTQNTVEGYDCATEAVTVAVAATNVKTTGNLTTTFTNKQLTYTVTWKDDTGTVLETDENVPFGTTPEYNGATPAKEATAQYTYSFNGWEPEPSAVTKDVTYTAQFKETVNKYLITWKNWDNSELQSGLVEYGRKPQFTGTPTKKRTGYTCVFDGWDSTVETVTGPATYTATFTETPNEYIYNVECKSTTGKNLGESTVTGTFGQTYAVTAPPLTGYTTPAAQTVTWDSETPKTITFVYEPIKYDIDYGEVDDPFIGDENTPSDFTVENDTFTLPQPTKTGYTFTGWTGSNGTTPQLVVTITKGERTEDLNFTANWQANKYTVTFNANGGTVPQANMEVTYDSAYGELPVATRSGYSFRGWYTDLSNDAPVADYTVYTIPGNSDLHAMWQLNTFTLTITAKNTKDSNQTYLFDIEGWQVEADRAKDQPIKLTVALCAGETKTIVGLPAGEYTVSDRQAWSWRYKPQKSTDCEYLDAAEYAVTFDYSDKQIENKNLWLNGYSNQNGSTRKRKWLW